MTQQEFETLTGMSVKDYVFDHAEDIYLNAGSLPKDVVCAEIKQNPWLLDSQVVCELTETAKAQTRLAASRLHDIEKLKAALLDACVLAADETTWRGAAELLGRATVITYKLANECDLSTDDVAYICENLK